jgi:tetratricopeptide (TPR) repeat protein
MREGVSLDGMKGWQKALIITGIILVSVIVTVILIYKGVIPVPGGPVTIGDRDAFGYPIDKGDASAVIALLEQKQFMQLNKLLDDLQIATEKDIRNEARLEITYDAFGVTNPNYEKLLNEWIEYSPESYQPYLARAVYRTELGWEKRGHKWAYQTSPEQFRQMQEYLETAELDIDKALALNKRAFVAYSTLFSIYLNIGTDQDERRLIQEALALYPQSFSLRVAYLHSRKPRWGGSYGEMNRFAQEAQRYVKQNPKLRTLLGLRYGDMASLLYSQDQYLGALFLYKMALSHGHYGLFHQELSNCYYFLDEYDLALKEANAAVSLQPQNADNYKSRAYIYAMLGQTKNALMDYSRCVSLERDLEELKRVTRDISSNLIIVAFDLQQKRRNQQAIYILNDAIQLDPSNHKAYYQRAQLLIHLTEPPKLNTSKAGLFWRRESIRRKADFESALADLDKAMELNPKDFDSCLLADWVLFQNQQWDEIIKRWEKFIDTNPKHARAYLERAGAYYHKRDLEAAYLDAKRSAELGNAEAKQRIKQLEQEIKQKRDLFQ